MTANTPDVRTAIIEGRQRARNALTVLLDGTPGYRSTGTFSSVEEVEKTFDLHAVDVFVLCLGARGLASQLIRSLKDRCPEAEILVLSDSAEKEDVLRAVSAGASGYLLGQTPPALLMSAIRELRDGGAPMSPSVARTVVESLHSTNKSAIIQASLTSRELAILRLLARGHSYKTAATRLRISIDTVRFHVRNVYQKLGVHSKLEAVLKGTRAGLCDCC